MKKLFAIVFMLATASVAAAQTSDVIVFKGAQLIDGTGAPPIKKSVLVIEGDRITAVGKEGKVHYPKNARVIDATGQYLLPGLWEKSCALCLWGLVSKWPQ